MLLPKHDITSNVAHLMMLVRALARQHVAPVCARHAPQLPTLQFSSASLSTDPCTALCLTLCDTP